LARERKIREEYNIGGAERTLGLIQNRSYSLAEKLRDRSRNAKDK
jgi:hypothetical protein